jgi:hypothetical protein
LQVKEDYVESCFWSCVDSGWELSRVVHDCVESYFCLGKLG